MVARVSFFVAAATALLLLLNTNAAPTDPKDAFSYSGNNGPEHWGSLNPSCSICSTGKLQSPVDILKEKVIHNKKLNPIKRGYYTVNATLVNHGFHIGLDLGNAGPLVLDGTTYPLLQMHWHVPSEHTINGVIYDAEAHLFHMNTDGNAVVIAILYKIGHPDPIIDMIQDKLDELAKEKCASNELAKVSVESFDAWKLRRNTRNYYSYAGSLTTPPCTEKVTWLVFPKVRSISKEQIQALQAPLLPTCKLNARPVQPLYGRTVELFDELKY